VSKLNKSKPTYEEMISNQYNQLMLVGGDNLDNKNDLNKILIPNINKSSEITTVVPDK